MDQSLLNLSCTGFLDALGSRSPVPGGGGVSALVGALSASLGHMVCEYTVGKKRYARFEDDVRAAMSSLTRLGQELQALVDEDASAYSLVSEAYALGKDDPARAGAVNRALDAAAVAPLRTMAACAQALDAFEELSLKGSMLLQADVYCACELAMSALRCARLNVLVNTSSMADRSRSAELEGQAEALLGRAEPVYEHVLSRVLKTIQKEA